jgi:hypothetical protein
MDMDVGRLECYRRRTGTLATDWHDLFALAWPREPGIRGPLPKSALFVKVELYEVLDCARQVSQLEGRQLGKENHMMASPGRFSSLLASKHVPCLPLT